MYTFENRCIENLDLPFGNDTTKIILNTEGTGTVGDISEDLRATLRYFAGDGSQSEYAKGLDEEVADVRKSEKRRVRDVQWISVSHRPKWKRRQSI